LPINIYKIETMRSEKVKSLRPELNLPCTSDDSLLSFQNAVLRPILKLQDDITLLLLDISVDYNKHRHKVTSDTKEEYAAYLKDLLHRDKSLRNQVIGAILGMMTREEMDIYKDNKREINKRIVQMQIDRYVTHYN